MPPHTVLLIDDHALFRKGVAQLIQMNPLFSIAGEAASGREGVEMATRLKPEIVLIDLNMPEVSGIETLQLMRDADVNARFIMLTVSDHERDVVAALRAGAHGYLLKDMDPEDLCVTLQKALAGAAVLSDAVTGSLVHALSGGQRMPAAQSDLTAREVEVLDYLVEGMCNKVIARKLGISVGTVKVHVKHVLRKLDLHSRLEAVVWRHEHGSRER
ncbi:MULTISPECIES: two-component system response regulator NarL [Paraburkholderia]|uniref:Two-component system response regulator NarL n=1 Tax=Paraburkholderia pallida TaxID=2547399 RepID=A0A4P7CXK7_9BURK|nr:MULTISPECIES: two-component system response regulator NarL [Paraburkholderia]QBQ99536.1 two-component system response regulator NarL [Paraburkholderia pallida]